MNIDDKKLKKILQEQREEYQHYLGACIEDFDSKIEVIAEQYLDIKETLDSHTKTLDLHTKILDSHTKTLDLHTKILDSHTKTLDLHTETIGSIKVDAEIIKTDIQFIKSRLKKKVDTEEFESLVKRVIRLEKLFQFQKAI